MEKGNFKKAMSVLAEEYMEAFHAMTEGEDISIVYNGRLSFSVDDFNSNYVSYNHDGTREMAPLSYFMDIDDLVYFVENGIDLMTLRRWAIYQCQMLELEVGEDPEDFRTYVENPHKIMKLAEMNAVRDSGIWRKQMELQDTMVAIRKKYRPDYRKEVRTTF